MPRGKENAPVGSKLRPDGVGMGVASKSEPCEPVTWGCLIVVRNSNGKVFKECYLRFFFWLLVFSLGIAVTVLL
jgi:hypothetical protein